MEHRLLPIVFGLSLGAVLRMFVLPTEAGASDCPIEILPVDLVSLDVPEDEVFFWTISFDADDSRVGLGEAGLILPGALVTRTGSSWWLEPEAE